MISTSKRSGASFISWTQVRTTRLRSAASPCFRRCEHTLYLVSQDQGNGYPEDLRRSTLYNNKRRPGRSRIVEYDKIAENERQAQSTARGVPLPFDKHRLLLRSEATSRTST